EQLADAWLVPRRWLLVDALHEPWPVDLVSATHDLERRSRALFPRKVQIWNRKLPGNTEHHPPGHHLVRGIPAVSAGDEVDARRLADGNVLALDRSVLK